MQSEALSVEEYLHELPEGRKDALERMRKLCLALLEGYEESMEYGMPSYKIPGGEVEIAFASQKNYISFYVMKQDVLDRYRGALAHLNVGKGCIRYTKPEKIDFDLVEEILDESHKSDAPIC